MTKHDHFVALLAPFVLGIALCSMMYADSRVKADSPTTIVSLSPSPTFSPTAIPSPTLPPRMIYIQTQVPGYLWWLVEWGSNKVLCDLTIDHTDEPIETDIIYGCGQVVYNKWMTSAGCYSTHAAKTATLCPGLYLFYVRSVTIDRETKVNISSSDIDGQHYVDDFVWTPDNRHLLAIGNVRSQNESLYLVDFISGTSVPILPESMFYANSGQTNLAWSPDGSKLLILCPTMQEERGCFVSVQRTGK